ncbi:MAG: Mpo1-like protein [Blastocatellia bacterium]
MSGKRFESFGDFWPFYVGEHRHPANRLLHFIGSTWALVCVLIFVATGRLWFLPLGLALGYGCAWIGHFFLEHNRPATFTYPAWSFMGDWKMWALTVTGRMDAEARRIERMI